MLATESRTDRKRLTTWLDGMGNHLAVPEARAFAALVRLVLAGETKEKSLFGQANPRRKEALEAAFSLLVAHARSGGQGGGVVRARRRRDARTRWAGASSCSTPSSPSAPPLARPARARQAVAKYLEQT